MPLGSPEIRGVDRNLLSEDMGFGKSPNRVQWQSPVGGLWKLEINMDLDSTETH